MEFQFKSRTLKSLYTSQKPSNKYPDNVVTTFFEITQIIKACKDISFLKYFSYIQYDVQTTAREDLHRFHLGEGFYLNAQLKQQENQELLELISIKK